VVWRRTGEITLVGKEFSLLTQWSRDALLSKKTYIYEVRTKEQADDGVELKAFVHDLDLKNS
jgi:hypothetical protein